MDAALRRYLKNRLNRKFGGHDVLYSKYDPVIPASAEREYRKIVNAYMGILRETLETELPKCKEIYKSVRDASVREKRRHDSATDPTDLMLAIAAVFTAIENALLSKIDGFGLRRRLENLARLTRKLTVKEWKKAVRATLAIDIREDYYLGDFYADQLLIWIRENVDLIKTIPKDSLDKMRDIIYDGYVNGKSTTEMMKDIRRVYSVSKRRAIFIARDQIAKLNGDIQRAQQMDAGIREYIWSTVEDERVRKSHRELNGRKFSWDDPPKNSDGRCCHPGQDFNCRCIGRPVFARDALNLPIDEDALKMTVAII